MFEDKEHESTSSAETAQTAVGCVGFLLLPMLAWLVIPRISALGSILVFSAYFVVWLALYLTASAQARSERDERQARREERQRALDDLLEGLRRVFGGVNWRTFDLEQFVTERAASLEVANEAAEMIYWEAYKRTLSQSRVTGAINQPLAQMAAVLRLSNRRRQEIEAAARMELYALELRRAIHNDSLSKSHVEALERLASHLGIQPASVRHFLPPVEVAYENYYRSMVENRRRLPFDVRLLNRVEFVLGIDDATSNAVRSNVSTELYRKRFNEITRSGTLEVANDADLLNLKSFFRMSDAAAFAAVRVDATALFENRIANATARGAQTIVEWRELRQAAQLIGLDEGQVRSIAKRHAVRFFESHLSLIERQPASEQFDEQELSDLQLFLGIDLKHAKPLLDRFYARYRLSQTRAGRLLTVPTNKLLESGELCHCDVSCQFSRKTLKGTRVTLQGEITITSRRIIFTTLTGGFEYTPARIVRLQQSPEGLFVQTSGATGTGIYETADREMFAAVLEGVTRKQKYLAAATSDSTRSRHIPDHVKQEVWARDGGKCVHCNAEDYLEFDHIIPHSRGGANSVNNVQVLCRRCNSEKSDRI